MIDNGQEGETERLRGLLGEANKTIRNQEQQIAKYSKLMSAAREVIKLAVWSRAGYSLGSKSIDDLWAALEGIQNSN
jgi:hypothetical protein